jgi:hypothetical protein
MHHHHIHTTLVPEHDPDATPDTATPLSTATAPVIRSRDAWIGAAAVLGGASCGAFALIANGRPPGVPGIPRATTDIDVLVLGGLALVAAACLGLASRGRATGRSPRTWRAGAAGALAGPALMVATLPGAAVIGDAAWFAFMVPGALMLVAGFAVTGVAIVRSAVVPRFTGASLAATALLLVACNVEDGRVLLLLPFAAAAMLLGATALVAAIPRRLAPPPTH